VINHGEQNFIINAWLKVYANSKTYGKVRSHIFFKEMPLIIENIIKSSNILMARSVDDNSQLFGCCIYDDQTLHFAYVKGIYRGLGLFTEMAKSIDKELKYYTLENTYTKIFRKSGMELNPFETFKFNHKS
jgi:hypothetical protein